MSPVVLAVSCPTALVLAHSEGLDQGVLTPAEQERMARFRRPSDGEDFQAAHLLIRTCAARLLGVRPGDVVIVQRCSTCGGPHGRPEVVGHPDIGVSLAHSRGLVAAAAGSAPVGIDIEAFPPAEGLVAGDLSAALSAAEIRAIDSTLDRPRAMLLAWVRKEACLKAGLVDLDGLEGFDLSALPLDPPPGDMAVRSLEHAGWTVHDWWDGRAGAVGAVVAPAGVELQLASA
ncbi:MAG TPA: 4'-phosphopantetheinyl transferase superfamily protein [Acidimicrobiia bacterium]|nr:4'-phosphopantetheinyl transferase superfamily protein [Acidimicrobiia bacterium]